MIFAMLQRGFHLVQCRLSCIVVANRSGKGALRAPVRKHIGDRRVDGMQVEPGLGEPILQGSNRRGVVIVEVASRREHFDGFKSVRRNLEQMRLLQPLFVIQVSRHSKPFHDSLPKT